MLIHACTCPYTAKFQTVSGGNFTALIKRHYIYIKSEKGHFFHALFPKREMNVESASKRGTVDISRNSLNPFYVSFHATVEQFHVSCPHSTHNSRYFLAKLAQNAR